MPREKQREREREHKCKLAAPMKGSAGSCPLSSSQFQSPGVLAVLWFLPFDFSKCPLCDFKLNVPILKLELRDSLL